MSLPQRIERSRAPKAGAGSRQRKSCKTALGAGDLLRLVKMGDGMPRIRTPPRLIALHYCIAGQGRRFTMGTSPSWTSGNEGQIPLGVRGASGVPLAFEQRGAGGGIRKLGGG